jgi:DNA polymerase (family 10)
MPVHNSDIAEIFDEIADLLEIQGESTFRVRAYRNAARMVGDLSKKVTDMVKAGENLTELPGIGKDLAEKMKEIAGSGKLEFLEELKTRVAPGLLDLLKISGLGPKKVNVLNRQLGVTDTQSLQKALATGAVRDLEGFGPKTEDNIKAGLKRIMESEVRFRIDRADETVGPLVQYLEDIRGVQKVTVAGSYRRRRETVGDLDILVTTKGNPSEVMERFTTYEDVKRILAHGEKKSSVVLRSGMQVDIRVVPEENYGAALQYFTGSKAHSVVLRGMAIKKGLKINEYGVFKGEKSIAGRTEEEVYKSVGLKFIPPELRENRGELEAARKRSALPRLVELDDIRGELHAHTILTDGKNTLEEMAGAARERGYEYLAITEHSKAVTVARGLDEKALGRHVDSIRKLGAKIKGLTLLAGVEVDILEDGSLDLADDILKELDIVVCSVHSRFNYPENKQTERIIRAMDNLYMTVLGHPTGRLIGERQAYAVDMERVLQAAAERGVHMELNAHPLRLDLTDIYCKTAKELGIKVAIATDAHSIQGLDYMRYGVGQARRGWLEKDDVLNTRGVKDLLKLLKRK